MGRPLAVTGEVLGRRTHSVEALMKRRGGQPGHSGGSGTSSHQPFPGGVGPHLQGSPRRAPHLPPTWGSLHHINENKYGDCDTSRPYHTEFLERKALFSEGPAPWGGGPRSGSSRGFMTCQEAGVCGWGLLCVLSPVGRAAPPGGSQGLPSFSCKPRTVFFLFALSWKKNTMS